MFINRSKIIYSNVFIKAKTIVYANKAKIIKIEIK